VKKELENQQNLERIKADRAHNMRPGTATSRSMMGSSQMSSRMGGKGARTGHKQPASKPSHH